jgi:hypothetical protein
VKQGLDTGRRQGYGSALADLWGGLSGTLTSLEALAAAPGDLDESALQTLPSLQYSLHRASELAAGLAPPLAVQEAHAELSVALVEARDATGEMIDALASGDPTAPAMFVYEWRGALFHLRFARHRLAWRPPAVAPQPPVAVAPPPFPWPALVAAALVSAGAFGFAAGAIVGLWPLWAAGLSLVAVSFAFYRT